MGFVTGSATDVEDLLDQWFDFLLANGWVADINYTTPGQSPNFGVINRKVDAASPLGSDPKNQVNIHCGFSVNNAVLQVGAATDNLFMVPMRDYGGSGDPGLNAIFGSNTLTISTQTNGVGWIYTNFPTQPFEQHWFFADNYYAYGVVEYASGFYRHFGLGQLNKTGKYFGGEFYYGSFIRQTASVIDVPLSQQNNIGFDGHVFSAEAQAKVFGQDVDKTGLTDWKGRQSPESGWFTANFFVTTVDGDDSNGGDRGSMITQGPRRGFHHPLYWTGQSSFNGHRPMYPQYAFTKFNATPDRVQLLGSLPDQRVMSMEQGLLPKDEFTIGADTWIVFPVTRKRPINVLDDTEQSLSFGISYKKVP
jgi:hypothetical protein